MGSRFLAFAFASAVCALSQPVFADDPRSIPCDAPPTWVPHAKSPLPDAMNFPAEFHPAPYDPKTLRTCDFHLWAWEAFLWLTATDSTTHKPRFESMLVPDSMRTGEKASPMAGRGQGGSPVNLLMQAGPNGVLVDQKGRAVYYEIYTNDAFNKFVIGNELNKPGGLLGFNAAMSFPVDSLTLKAAWKVLDDSEDKSKFFWRTARVAKLVNRNGKIAVDPTKTEEVNLALVGFHVVGTVKDHEEMIWATFEHEDNAPDLPPNLVTDPKPSTETMDKDAVVSDKTWTFYAAGTKFKDCNFNAADKRVLTLDEATQKLSPVTQVCRLFPYGSGPAKAANAKAIQELNDSAIAQLKKQNDVWQHYKEIGAVWFDTDSGAHLSPNCAYTDPNKTCGARLTGSTNLSNAVIETFTQGASAQGQCFACHNTLQQFPDTKAIATLPGKDVNLSHVLLDKYFSSAAGK